MDGMRLVIDANPDLEEAGTTRYLFNAVTQEWFVKVHVLFENGTVDMYVLAHELGHAVWIATGQRSDGIREANDYVQRHPDEKYAHFMSRSRPVREGIVQEEEWAWKIARELLADEEHDPAVLNAREQEGLASYRAALLG